MNPRAVISIHPEGFSGCTDPVTVPLFTLPRSDAMPKAFSFATSPFFVTHLVITHLVMACAGCVYDWDVGPSAPDGGGSAGSGAGGSDAGADCAVLQATLDAARDKAKACVFGVAGQCTASIADERGCTSYMNDATGADGLAFSQAVDAFVAAGCTPSPLPCTISPASCLYVTGKPTCVP